jgi:hypothetical protein
MEHVPAALGNALVKEGDGKYLPNKRLGVLELIEIF